MATLLRNGASADLGRSSDTAYTALSAAVIERQYGTALELLRGGADAWGESPELRRAQTGTPFELSVKLGK